MPVEHWETELLGTLLGLDIVFTVFLFWWHCKNVLRVYDIEKGIQNFFSAVYSRLELLEGKQQQESEVPEVSEVPEQSPYNVETPMIP